VLDFGVLVHEAVICTITEKVFEFLDGNVFVGFDLKWKEIFEFSVRTLDKEVLNLDCNDDFLIVER
jgi:hypothetical protein